MTRTTPFPMTERIQFRSAKSVIAGSTKAKPMTTLGRHPMVTKRFVLTSRLVIALNVTCPLYPGQTGSRSMIIGLEFHDSSGDSFQIEPSGFPVLTRH
tara:strand:- start:254 stop:547 length:294 start_codon:yes stop_codon:yes gene_type:complete